VCVRGKGHCACHTSSSQRSVMPPGCPSHAHTHTRTHTHTHTRNARACGPASRAGRADNALG
jgi:hypothetical protein